MKDISTLIQQYMDATIEYRRHIHANPELSMEEDKTAAFVAQTLRSIGIEPQEHVGGNGVVGLIEGARPGKCIALRADLDAMPLQETTSLSFASQTPGVCHACGHDMHTAMLLGAAHVLYALRDELSGSIKLIFQPAEESVLTGGAPDMIADGVLERPHVDALIAQHMWPQFPTGTVAIRNGAMMASSDRFFITINGRSSHGSAPEDGVDAIVIAAQVISAMQTIVSRGISPLDSAVVSIGVIHGGDRYNVISNQVKMEGTCRNLNPLVRNQMAKRIEQVIRGVTDAMGGTYDFRYCLGYAPTVNNPQMFELVYSVMKEQLGSSAVIPPTSALGGEDFSYFCEERPCAFFWLGCRRPEVLFSDTFPIHNGGFSPDENAMPIGINILVRSALKFLGE